MRVYLLICLVIGLTLADKLDRTYLPPPGAKLSGGSPGSIDVPIEYPKESYNTQSQLPSKYPQNPQLNSGNSLQPGKNVNYQGFPSTGSSILPTTTTSYAFTQTTNYRPNNQYQSNRPTDSNGYIENNNSFSNKPLIGNPSLPVINSNTPGQEGFNSNQNSLRDRNNIGLPNQNKPNLEFTYSNPNVPSNQANYQNTRFKSPNSSSIYNSTPSQGSFFNQNIPREQGVNYENLRPQSPDSSLINIGAPNQENLGFGKNVYSKLPFESRPTMTNDRFEQNNPNVRPGQQYPQYSINNQQNGLIGDKSLYPSTTGAALDPSGYPISTTEFPFISSTTSKNNNPTTPYFNSKTTNAQQYLPNQFPVLTAKYPESSKDTLQNFSNTGVNYNEQSRLSDNPSKSDLSQNYSPFPKNFDSKIATPVTKLSQNQLKAERPETESDRNAYILNYENQMSPEGFAYSFDTSNGIHADEAGTAKDGVKALGSYSYTGDDGKVYNIIYSADENGFQPQGDHLPTPPPIPEAIQKVIEQSKKDSEAGINDDGAYDEQKYGYKNYDAEVPQKYRFQNGNIKKPYNNFENQRNDGNIDENVTEKLYQPTDRFPTKNYSEDTIYKNNFREPYQTAATPGKQSLTVNEPNFFPSTVDRNLYDSNNGKETTIINEPSRKIVQRPSNELNKYNISKNQYEISPTDNYDDIINSAKIPNINQNPGDINNKKILQSKNTLTTEYPTSNEEIYEKYFTDSPNLSSKYNNNSKTASNENKQIPFGDYNNDNNNKFGSASIDSNLYTKSDGYNKNKEFDGKGYQYIPPKTVFRDQTIGFDSENLSKQNNNNQNLPTTIRPFVTPFVYEDTLPKNETINKDPAYQVREKDRIPNISNQPTNTNYQSSPEYNSVSPSTTRVPTIPLDNNRYKITPTNKNYQQLLTKSNNMYPTTYKPFEKNYQNTLRPDYLSPSSKLNTASIEYPSTTPIYNQAYNLQSDNLQNNKQIPFGMKLNSLYRQKPSFSNDFNNISNGPKQSDFNLPNTTYIEQAGNTGNRNEGKNDNQNPNIAFGKYDNQPVITYRPNNQYNGYADNTQNPYQTVNKYNNLPNTSFRPSNPFNTESGDIQVPNQITDKYYNLPNNQYNEFTGNNQRPYQAERKYNGLPNVNYRPNSPNNEYSADIQGQNQIIGEYNKIPSTTYRPNNQYNNYEGDTQRPNQANGKFNNLPSTIYRPNNPYNEYSGDVQRPNQIVDNYNNLPSTDYVPNNQNNKYGVDTQRPYQTTGNYNDLPSTTYRPNNPYNKYTANSQRPGQTTGKYNDLSGTTYRPDKGDTQRPNQIDNKYNNLPSTTYGPNNQYNEYAGNTQSPYQVGKKYNNLPSTTYRPNNSYNEYVTDAQSLNPDNSKYFKSQPSATYKPNSSQDEYASSSQNLNKDESNYDNLPSTTYRPNSSYQNQATNNQNLNETFDKYGKPFRQGQPNTNSPGTNTPLYGDEKFTVGGKPNKEYQSTTYGPGTQFQESISYKPRPTIDIVSKPKLIKNEGTNEKSKPTTNVFLPSTYRPGYYTEKDFSEPSTSDQTERPLFSYNKNNLGQISSTYSPTYSSAPVNYGTTETSVKNDFNLDDENTRKVGEDFSGPKRPQSYDSETGYHYKK